MKTGDEGEAEGVMAVILEFLVSRSISTMLVKLFFSATSRVYGEEVKKIQFIILEIFYSQTTSSLLPLPHSLSLPCGGASPNPPVSS